MNREGGLLFIDVQDVQGDSSDRAAMRKLESCRTLALLERSGNLPKSPEDHVCSSSEDVGASFSFLHCFDGDALSSEVYNNSEQDQRQSARRCNRRSSVASSYTLNTLGERRGPRYKTEELCYCTEELGAESIVAVGNDGSTEVQQEALPGEIQEGKDTPKADPRVRIGKTLSCPPDSSCDIARQNLSSRLSTLGHVRAFPPPISSLLSNRPLMRGFKSDGRFVLQRVVMRSRRSFRAIREDGRLRLELMPQNIEEEDGQLFVSSSEPVSEGEVEEGVSAGKQTIPTSTSPHKEEDITSPKPGSLREYCSPWRPIAGGGGDSEFLKQEKLLYNFDAKCLFSEDEPLRVSTSSELSSSSSSEELSADSSFAWWQQSASGLKGGSRSDHLEDHLVSSEAGSHCRVRYDGDTHHGFAIVNLCSFRPDLLFLHFERSKAGLKINGVYCFKDNEVEAGKRGNSKSVRNRAYNQLRILGTCSEISKDELFSFQSQGCKSQAKGTNFFGHWKAGQYNCHTMYPASGDSFFSRLFQPRLDLFLTT